MGAFAFRESRVAGRASAIRMQLMTEKNNLKKATLFIFSVAGLILVILGWQLINYERTLPFLNAGGLKIGGMKMNLAKEILENRRQEFEAQKITFVYENKTWQFTPRQLGIEIDVEKILTEAVSLGHGDNFWAATGEQLQALFSEKNIPIIYNLDFSKLNRALADFTAIEEPPRNAALKYNAASDDFEILPAQKGTLIQRAQLIEGVLNNFTKPDQPVYLKLAESEPPINENHLTAARQAAQNLIEQAPYFLQSPDTSWRLEKQDVADWISVISSPDTPQEAKISLAQNKISDFLSSITPSINREPLNASLGWENNELKFVFLPQNGQKLNLEQSVAEIQRAILAGQKNITLAVDVIEPQIGYQNIKELGLTTLLGRGESNFAGSPKNRKHNLALGASKFNGLLIKSGEEFSFAQSIGAIDEQAGYLPELVIKTNKTVPEFGGGLCQVSTTLFRVAVNSGLKITERHPHAYPVHYYDPPGFDATVYPPSPDLKFLNDTPADILLQSHVDGNKLIFEIYGTADGREVKIKGPTILQKNPDGSLKTTLTQEIWRQGQLERSEIFRSSYKSPNLYPISTSATLQTR